MPAWGTPYVAYQQTKYYKTAWTFSWTVPAWPTSIKIIWVWWGWWAWSGWPWNWWGGWWWASASAWTFSVTQWQVITIKVWAKGAWSNWYNWCTIGYNWSNTSVIISWVTYVLWQGWQGWQGWTWPCWVTWKWWAKIPASSKITDTYSAWASAVWSTWWASSLNTLSYLSFPSAYFSYGKWWNAAKWNWKWGLVIIKY